MYERVPGHQLALVESNNNPSTASTTNLPIDSIAFASTMASNYFQQLPSSPTAPLASTHTTGDLPSPNPWSSNSGLSDDFASFAYSSSSPSTAPFASSSSSSSISSQVFPTQSTSSASPPALPLNNGLNSAFADDSVSSILDASHSNMESGNYFFDSTARSKDATGGDNLHISPTSSIGTSHQSNNNNNNNNNNNGHSANGGGAKYNSNNKPRYLDVPSLGGLRNLQVLEVRVSSLLRCAEACLQETSFVCLSANFLRVSSLCVQVTFRFCIFSLPSSAS